MTHDDRDDEPFDLFGGLFDAIRRAGAADGGRFTGSDRVGDGETSIEFDYTVRTGLGPASRSRKGHPSLGGSSPVSGRDDGADRPVRVDVVGDGRRVTAEIGDTDVTTADDARVAIDSSNLRITVDGDVVATAALGDGPWTVEDRSLNNGVLQVSVTPA